MKKIRIVLVQQIWWQFGTAKTDENGKRLQQILKHSTILPSNRKAHTSKVEWSIDGGHLRTRETQNKLQSGQRISSVTRARTISSSSTNQRPRWRLRARTRVGEEKPTPLSNQEAPTLPEDENDKKWSSAVVGCARRRSACLWWQKGTRATTCWGHWWLRAFDVLKHRRLRSDVRKACATQETAVVSSSRKAPSMCWATLRNQSWETKQERHQAIGSVVTRQVATWTSFECKMQSQEHGTRFMRTLETRKTSVEAALTSEARWRCDCKLHGAAVAELGVQREAQESLRKRRRVRAGNGLRIESKAQGDATTTQWNESSQGQDLVRYMTPSSRRGRLENIISSKTRPCMCLSIVHMTRSELRAMCKRPSAQLTGSHRPTTCCGWATESAWSRSASSRRALACQKKPRSIEELEGSLRPEHSIFFDTIRWRSGECSTGNGTGDERIRRLICFPFDVGHISLPLGAKNLEAYSNEWERTAPEERGGWRRICCSVNVRRARGCTCCWLPTTSVDWSARAEQWRSRASCWRVGPCLRCDGLTWCLEKRQKCGGPSLMTELVLVKKRYVWRLQRCRTSQQRVCWSCAEAQRSPNMSALRCRIPRLDDSMSLTACRIQRVSLMNLLGGHRYHAQGTPSARKRYMVANTATAMVHHRPQGNEESEERIEVTCAGCARKEGWRKDVAAASGSLSLTTMLDCLLGRCG